MKQKIKESKGITLIALVITIIVLLVLVGVSIAMLMGDNGILGKSKQAEQEQIKVEMKEQLILALQGLQAEKKGKATLEDITDDWIKREPLSNYEVAIIDTTTESRKIRMSKNSIIQQFIVNDKLELKEVKPEEDLVFFYQETNREGNKVYVQIHVKQEEIGIVGIELPNSTLLQYATKKEEIVLDYEVEVGRADKIKIILENRITIEKVVLINYYNVEIHLAEGLNINNTLKQIEMGKEYQAQLTEKKGYKLSTIEVTMNGTPVNIDEVGGNIRIENVIGNIVINAESTRLDWISITNFDVVAVCDKHFQYGITKSDINTCLFNGITIEQGNYGGLLLGGQYDKNFIEFDVLVDLKIFSYGYYVRDAGGSTGAEAKFQKKENGVFQDYKTVKTFSNNERYELISLEEGTYRLMRVPFPGTESGIWDKGYIAFTEWELEPLEK